jgi:hypothetical protein
MNMPETSFGLVGPFCVVEPFGQRVTTISGLGHLPDSQGFFETVWCGRTALQLRVFEELG